MNINTLSRFITNGRLNDYQELALRTMNKLSPEDDKILGVLGLAGESGEVVDLVKKEIYHGHNSNPEKILKELGDVLWYLAVLADAYGITLETVAMTNIAKLQARYTEGFSHEASRNRKPEEEPHMCTGPFHSLSFIEPGTQCQECKDRIISGYVIWNKTLCRAMTSGEGNMKVFDTKEQAEEVMRHGARSISHNPHQDLDGVDVSNYEVRPIRF